MNLAFGNTIKELRVKRGLSQEKLAEHLGVAPQSISKWERNEGYPDITFLIPLAEFFGVTLDTLMGRDAAQKELKIKNILAQIDHFWHIGDHESKNRLIKEAYEEFPYDFRIVSWYTVVLADVENISENQREIECLCEYILNECTEDKYRYEAISSLIDLYSHLGKPETAKTYVDRLPDMNYSKEFLMCDIYPRDNEQKYADMAYYLNRSLENILWMISQMAAHKPNLHRCDRISVLEQACRIADAAYPAFDHGVCHSSMGDIYLLLFKYYSEENMCDHALAALRKAFVHEKVLDEISDCCITQQSAVFRGNIYDMRKTYSGTKSNSVYWLFERLGEAPFRFDCYNADPAYQRILDEYRPYAVEDNTVEGNDAL